MICIKKVDKYNLNTQRQYIWYERQRDIARWLFGGDDGLSDTEIFVINGFSIPSKSTISPVILNNQRKYECSCCFFLNSYIFIINPFRFNSQLSQLSIILLSNFCRVRFPNLGISALLFAYLISFCQKHRHWINILTVSFCNSTIFAEVLTKC